jgi:hypothetical protein
MQVFPENFHDSFFLLKFIVFCYRHIPNVNIIPMQKAMVVKVYMERLLNILNKKDI